MLGKNFFKNCFFQTQNQTNKLEFNTMPKGLIEFRMIRALFDYIILHFLRTGKHNGFVEDEKIEGRKTLMLIVATPLDLSALLEEFQNADRPYQDHIIKFLKHQVPKAWTPLHAFPDENLKLMDSELLHDFETKYRDAMRTLLNSDERLNYGPEKPSNYESNLPFDK